MDAEIQDDRTTEKKETCNYIFACNCQLYSWLRPTVVFKSLVYTGAIRQNIVIETILCFLFFSSLCFNPVLYAFRSTNFQRGLRRVIFCCETQSETDVD